MQSILKELGEIMCSYCEDRVDKTCCHDCDIIQEVVDVLKKYEIE